MAQAFGVIMGDKNRVDALIENDRSTWEKICDVLNDFIISIRRALSGAKAAQISEYDRIAFSGLLSKAEEMERVLREALDAEGDSALAGASAALRFDSASGSAQNDTEAAAEEEKSTSGEVKYSIRQGLYDDLADIRKQKPTDNDELLIGTTSDFLVDVLKAEPLKVTMPKSKVYAAMVTEEEAISENRYEADLNYHGLGEQKLYDALVASEAPVVTFVAENGIDEEGGEVVDRSDRIVLVTDEVKDGKNIVVMEVETPGFTEGARCTANKDITVYDRKAIKKDIATAIADNRLLHYDKKRSHTITAGGRAYNPPNAIQNVDFDTNIAQFWENVKWKKSGSEAQLEAPGTEKGTAMEEAFNKAFEVSNTKSSRKRDDEERGKIYELEKENRKQKKLIEQLKSRMREMDKVVVRGTVDAKAVRAAARELINRYGGDKRRTSDGVVPLTENGLGSHINRSSSEDTIPQVPEKSNRKNLLKETDGAGRDPSTALRSMTRGSGTEFRVRGYESRGAGCYDEPAGFS